MASRSLQPKISSGFARFFSSRRLALYLLAALIGVAVLGMIIPQQSLLPVNDFHLWQKSFPRLSRLAIDMGFTRIYESPLFLIIITWFSLALFFCTVHRVKKISRRPARSLNAVPQQQNRECITFITACPVAAVSDRLPSFLRKKRYKTTTFCQGEQTTITARRGHLGKWGSILFHCSFLVLLSGALLTTWGRIEGTLLLTEGQSVSGLPTDYISSSRTPLRTMPPFDFSLRYDNLLTPPGSDNGPRNNLTATTRDNKRIHLQTRDFHPAKINGFTLYQKESGFSPSIRLGTNSDPSFFHSFIALHSSVIDGIAEHQDTFTVPNTDIFVTLHLISPDKTANVPASATNLTVAITRAGRQEIEADLARGQTLSFDEYTLQFDELRHWSSFRVVRDPGVLVLYIAFLLAAIGLGLRLHFRAERLFFCLSNYEDGCRVVLTANTDGEKSFFQNNLHIMTNHLQKYLSKDS